MVNKFTFKTERPTGRYRSFWPEYHKIRFGKTEVGQIIDKEWKIRLIVMKEDINEDPNDTFCDFKWITLKKEFASLQEAKDWLNKPETLKGLLTKYILKSEDE